MTVQEQRIPATADETVRMLYAFATQHAQQPFTRLHLQMPAMGDELVALWQREHERAGEREQAEPIYGFLSGIGRWSYQKVTSEDGGTIEFQVLPTGLAEADYLAIASFALPLGFRQETHAPASEQFASAIEGMFSPAWVALSQVMSTVTTAGSRSTKPLPAATYDAYMDFALALADSTYQAAYWFIHSGSAQQWESWMHRLGEQKIDVNLALLVCHLLWQNRARGGVQGINERLQLSQSLELPYRYDFSEQQWGYAADIPYPDFPDALAAWHEHTCPAGGGMACTCEWGYLCRGCYNHRLVEGRELLGVEQRGGRCIRCWTAESTEGVATLLH